MHRLPPLCPESGRFALPMADRSAAALGELLLARKPAAEAPPLATALAEDPLLLLWSVWMASREGLVPEALRDVAAWLAGRALDLLEWPEGADLPPLGRDDPLSVALAGMVAQSLALADLGAHLAEADGSIKPETAAFRGLLGYGAEMLAAIEPEAEMHLGVSESSAAEKTSEVSETSEVLQSVLFAESPESIEPDVLRHARGVLAGEEPLPEGIDVDLDAVRQRAEQGRRRWLAPDRRADWLVRLAAILRRLRALEEEFQHTLETEKLAAMAEFAAGAGHEINNPLTVIAGRAQLYLRDESDPEKRRALALISAQAMRVHEMIADLMLFARPPEPEPEPIDAVDLLDRVIEESLPDAVAREIALRRTGAEGPIPLTADPTQLTVALRALCRNAMEALGGAGTIEFGAEARGGEVLLRVSDDGPGIPPEERRHIFDPYYSARQAGRGLGLGLSKAWRIVTNHGGRIDVESEPGEGTVFTITLPR